MTFSIFSRTLLDYLKMANSPERVFNIQTFIFLDLETTGIDKDCRILELSMIAISRNDLLSMKGSKSKGSKRNSKLPNTPRVLHKYTRLYYPRKLIYPLVEKLTGLSNQSLQHLAPFNVESASAIQMFLQLPKPVCLVAHNGNTFDFPILKAELLNVNCDNLKEVLCSDSLLFTRNFELEEIKAITELSIDFKDSDMTACQNHENSTVAQTNGTTCTSDVLEAIPSSSQDIFVTPQKIIPHNSQSNGLKTPTKRRSHPFKNGDLTPQQASQKKVNGTDLNIAKRALYAQKPAYNKKPFSQPSLYYRLFREEYVAHTAETDAFALMNICGFYGKDFVDWADRNVTEFKDVNPRWTTRRSFVL